MKITTKICIKCCKEKLLAKEFFNKRSDTNKWLGQCKECIKIYKKEYGRKNKEKINTYHRKYYKNKNVVVQSGDFKICTKCDKKLDRCNNFRTLSSGYQSSWCRGCERSKNKEWYEKNKKKHQELVKKWKKENPQKAKEIASKSSKKIYIKNRDKILKQKREYNKRSEVVSRRNKWQRERTKNNPIFKIRGNISRAVNYALKKRRSSKRGLSVFNFLDYSINDLKICLENKFEPWMSWNNYGIYKSGGPRKWHLDHIVPQVKLPYDSMKHPNFKKCWALSNLRPLEAVANMSKGAK